MAQMTGTEILALARLHAQDQGSSPAVVDADALLLLNDHLLRWGQDVDVRVTDLSAASSGCTVPAGASNVVLTDTTIEDILTFHPSAGNTVSYPLSPPLGPSRVGVDRIWAEYNRIVPGNQQVISGNQWTLWACERDTENSDAWNVHVYPALTTQGFATLRVTKRLAINALTDTPDITYRAGRIVARLLAWDMAHKQKQNDNAWLDGILMPIPQQVLTKWFGQARFAGASQNSQRDFGVLSR